MFIDEIKKAIIKAKLEEKHTMVIGKETLKEYNSSAVYSTVEKLACIEAKTIDHALYLIEQYKKMGVNIFDDRLQFILSR